MILGLIGAVLVAGAAIGGWYWWKSHQAPALTQVASTTPPAAAAPAPPVEDKKSPLGDSRLLRLPPKRHRCSGGERIETCSRSRKPKEKLEAQPVVPPIPAPAPAPSLLRPCATPAPHAAQAGAQASDSNDAPDRQRRSAVRH